MIKSCDRASGNFVGPSIDTLLADRGIAFFSGLRAWASTRLSVGQMWPGRHLIHRLVCASFFEAGTADSLCRRDRSPRILGQLPELRIPWIEAVSPAII